MPSPLPGAALFGIAYAWAVIDEPANGANIGAGVLGVVGIALFGIGVLWLVGNLLVRLWRFASRVVKPS